MHSIALSILTGLVPYLPIHWLLLEENFRRITLSIAPCGLLSAITPALRSVRPVRQRSLVVDSINLQPDRRPLRPRRRCQTMRTLLKRGESHLVSLRCRNRLRACWRVSLQTWPPAGTFSRPCSAQVVLVKSMSSLVAVLPRLCLPNEPRALRPQPQDGLAQRHRR